MTGASTIRKRAPEQRRQMATVTGSGELAWVSWSPCHLRHSLQFSSCFSGLFLKWLFKTCFPFFLFHKPYSPPTTGIYLRRDWGGRAFPHETGSKQNSWLTGGPSDHGTYCHIEEGFSTFPISEHFKHRKSCLLTKHKAGFALSYTQESIYCAFVKGWATSRCCLLLFFDANS